jgi:hypothetical protein
MIPVDSDHDIQSDTPSAIPRGVLRQCGGDLRDTHSEVYPYCRIMEVSSVYRHARVMHPRVMRLPGTPPGLIAQLPYVKLCLPKPDINWRFDRRDNL